MEVIGGVFIAKENAHSIEMIARQSIEGAQSVTIDVVDPRQDNREYQLNITFREPLGNAEQGGGEAAKFNVVDGLTEAGERVVVSLGEQASRGQRKPTVILQKPVH